MACMYMKETLKHGVGSLIVCYI